MRRGFSLVEALVSITILLVGVMAVVSLGIAMVTQARFTNAQVVAGQLAREGIEVVRSIRDSNWLKAEDAGVLGTWNNELVSGTDYSAVLEWDSSTNTWTMDFDAIDFGNCVTGFDCTRLYSNTATFEQAQFASAPSASWTETEYQRLVRLFPICRSLTDETIETVLTADGTTCVAGSEEQVGIDVQVEVRWKEKGVSRSTTMEEYIYDWKY